MANLQLVYAPNNSQLYVLPVPAQFGRDPTTSDSTYTPGQLWYNTASSTIWIYKTAGIWSILVASGGTALSVLGTANQITASTVGTVTTLSIPSAFTAPGSITAAAGAITATNGNLVLGTAGNKLSIATGTNASVGTSGALAASVATVLTTAVTASSKIFLTRAAAAGTLGNLSVGVITAGTSFTITTDNALDLSTVNWLIIN